MRSIIWVLATSLTFALSAADCGAQQGGRDYYAPRVTADDQQLFINVEKYHLAPTQEKRGKKAFAGAKGDVEFILRYYPNHPVALDLLSQLCTAYPVPPSCDADLWFQKAIAVNEQAAPTYVVYGIHLQRKGKTAEAVSQYRSALRLDPNSTNAHYNIALALVDLKQYEEANAHAQLAYAAGVTYTGLRDKLTRTGKWKPLGADEISQLLRNQTDENTTGSSSKMPSSPARK